MNQARTKGHETNMKMKLRNWLKPANTVASLGLAAAIIGLQGLMIHMLRLSWEQNRELAERSARLTIENSALKLQSKGRP